MRQQLKPLLISVQEAARICDASRGWVYRQEERDPSFPRLIRLGKRKTVLLYQSLQAWVELREKKATPPVRGVGNPTLDVDKK